MPEAVPPLVPAPFSATAAARLAQLGSGDAAVAAAGLLADAVQRARVLRLLVASDYAFERLRRHPQDLAGILGLPGAALPALPDAGATDFEQQLRRHRHAAGLAIAVRDLEGTDTLQQTLAATSALAECCLQRALEHAELQVHERHGLLRDAGGHPQRMVVFALGKLGGCELNFSSDVDLVFGYPAPGHSDGARPLDADGWCARLGQRLIQLLSEPQAEGFVYRVDMRLRPFGNVGRLALGFDAMEQYFQREGRDWERYAWIKARPVAGDCAAGAQFLDTLRPFIYRRYLDYTAFDGLREMKGLIAEDVQRRDLAGHLKLGAGGIREVEFIAQLLQMIRGGREPALRTTGLLPALAALQALGHLGADAAQRLREAYGFMRRLENRLQLVREEQTHSLPEDALLRARLAASMGLQHWAELDSALQRHRAAVSAEFEQVFDAPRPRSPAVAAFAEYWNTIGEAGASERLEAAGLQPAGLLHAQLHGFAHSPALSSLSARARRRLDAVLPALLSAAAASSAPQAAVERVLKLLHAILRRSSYLALLAEQPAALTRVVEVMGASALLAERIVEHPLLLDDLLDQRSEQPPEDHAAIIGELARVLAGVPRDDTGAQLQALNEFHQSHSFRIGLASLFRRQHAPRSAQQLAWVAEAIVQRLLPQAIVELARNHGCVPGADAHGSVAVIGYGSFGGCELGFGSDLDLVFLYDGALLGNASAGTRPLDAPVYYARLMQRLVNLLATPTAAGRLYEADLRLRPDGAKGLLVSTLQSYAEYQGERAWTWEHQALVRARFVAGSPALAQRFAAVRGEVLGRRRDPSALRRDVAAMRARMRVELDRSRAELFDLKQGQGGLVDLEFLLQALVLQHAHQGPALQQPTATPALIAALADHDLLDTATARALADAHATLLQRALDCMLDARPRLVRSDAAVASARAAVHGAWQTQQLHP